MTSLLRSTHSRVVTAIVTAALVVATLTASEQPARSVSPGVEVVYIADGRNFPDALVGSVLAAANNTSILTVAGTNAGNFIPQPTKDELTRLEPLNIVILGGPGAVSTAVEAELADYTTGSVSRLDGDDRYETAVAISNAIPDTVKRALNADDADLLDGKDSTRFAQADLQVRHGSTGFHLVSGGCGDPAEVRGTHFLTIQPGCATNVSIVAGLDSPFDAGVPGLFGTHLFGELTAVDLCYSVGNSADRIHTVRVRAADGTQVATSPSMFLNATQMTCADIPLNFNGTTARTLLPLHVEVIFLPQAWPGREVTIYGMRTTWTTFNNQIIVGP